MGLMNPYKINRLFQILNLYLYYADALSYVFVYLISALMFDYNVIYFYLFFNKYNSCALFLGYKYHIHVVTY